MGNRVKVRRNGKKRRIACRTDLPFERRALPQAGCLCYVIPRIMADASNPKCQRG